SPPLPSRFSDPPVRRLVAFVPAHRCGAALDFHQVPFWAPMRKTDSKINIRCMTDLCQRVIVVRLYQEDRSLFGRRRGVFLLALPLCAERALPLCDVGSIALGIDKRVCAARLHLFVLGLQAEVRTVGA